MQKTSLVIDLGHGIQRLTWLKCTRLIREPRFKIPPSVDGPIRERSADRPGSVPDRNPLVQPACSRDFIVIGQKAEPALLIGPRSTFPGRHWLRVKLANPLSGELPSGRREIKVKKRARDRRLRRTGGRTQGRRQAEGAPRDAAKARGAARTLRAPEQPFYPRKGQQTCAFRPRRLRERRFMEGYWG